MTISTTAMSMMNTSSFCLKKEVVDRHFRWASVYKFIVLVSVFCSMNIDTLDMFSKDGAYTISIFEMLFYQLLVCVPYMFMDCFIKQYTKKMDGYSLLNPLLRGVQFGIFLQTAFLSVMNSSIISDIWRYFGTSFKELPNWNICRSHDKANCISRQKLFYKCFYHIEGTRRVKLTSTSAHYYYINMFKSSDRNTLTLKVFFALVVWIVNFFVTSVADETLYKICRFTYLSRVISTLGVMALILITKTETAFSAFGQIMAWEGEFNYGYAILVGTFAYNIGRLSFYDYEALSPYTMTDNGVIFYMLQFNIEGMVRSWIFSSMMMALKECVIFADANINSHYYLFCLMPLSAECMPMTRVYTLYVYFQLLLGMTIQLSMMTLSMAKLLQSEFRSVKTIYFVGLLCFAGITITMPLSMYLVTRFNGFCTGLYRGLDLATAIMAFLKVFIIVFVYGIRTFSKDIHYWLGFKPTKYWELTWTLLPVTCLTISIVMSCEEPHKADGKEPVQMRTTHIITLVSVIHTSEGITKITEHRSIPVVISWVTLTILIVAIINIRTIALYLINNVLGRAFVASVKYGPPDPEDRQKRRVFDETIELRRCRHQCHILDEEVDCNHLLPMTTLSLYSISSDSIEDFYKASRYKKHDSIALEIENP